MVMSNAVERGRDCRPQTEVECGWHVKLALMCVVNIPFGRQFYKSNENGEWVLLLEEVRSAWTSLPLNFGSTAERAFQSTAAARAGSTRRGSTQGRLGSEPVIYPSAVVAYVCYG